MADCLMTASFFELEKNTDHILDILISLYRLLLGVTPTPQKFVEL